MPKKKIDRHWHCLSGWLDNTTNYHLTSERHFYSSTLRELGVKVLRGMRLDGERDEDGFYGEAEVLYREFRAYNTPEEPWGLIWLLYAYGAVNWSVALEHPDVGVICPYIHKLVLFRRPDGSFHYRHGDKWMSHPDRLHPEDATGIGRQMIHDLRHAERKRWDEAKAKLAKDEEDWRYRNCPSRKKRLSFK